MSTEEIIDTWKHGENNPEKQKLPIRIPTHLTGKQELSDKDLETVEGGVVVGEFTSGYPPADY